MPLIWRGLGIAVPIIFFITGWIVSFWFGEGETTLGNSSFIGWTAMYSGIVILLLGLAMLGAGGGEDGEPKKKHDFFYLPIFVWGLLLGALSLYLLVFTGKAATPDEPVVENQEVVVPAPTTRMVNLYNPTDAILTYIVADENGEGLISRKKVEPNSFQKLELEKGTYLFSAYNEDKKTTLSLPATKEIAADEKKYKMHKDDEGSFYQRILNPMTKENDDYDGAWLILDGETQMIVAEISDVCNAEVTTEDVEGMDWEAAIFETFEGNDLAEPMFKQYKKDHLIKMIEPGDKIPSEKAENEVYYMLIPFDGQGEAADAVKRAVLEARF